MFIDGLEYTLFRDYDAGKYGTLSYDGKATYLDSRVQKILIVPCREANKSAVATDVGLILTTAICAGIPAAATFLQGRRAQKKGEDGKFFTTLVHEYMKISQIRPSPARGWPNWLYSDLRCGLAHNFTVLRGGIEYENETYVEIKPYGPELNPVKFLDDFSSGWSMYLAEVANGGPNSEVGKKFECRFNQIFRD